MRTSSPATATPSGGRTATSSVEALVARASSDFLREWEAGPAPRSPGSRTWVGPRVPVREQRARERATERLADRLEAELLAFPGRSARRARDRAAWRARVRELLAREAEGPHGPPPVELGPLLDEEAFACTRAFAREARAFAPDVGVDEVFQALRNAWIMNHLQRLVGAPVALTPSVFAYSMLYPWTDNRLDDAGVPPAAKRRTGAWLGRRLAGAPERAEGSYRGELDRLVAAIEREHPRPAAPDVWAALLAIHRAQLASLAAQGGPRPATEREVLAISVPKGGASVLADGYLVARTLAPPEARALFDYGVLLQLLDDLQDVAADRAAGHWTVFSRLAGREPLDAPASRLLARLAAVLDEVAAQARARVPGLAALTRRSCTALYVQAVAARARAFTPGFVADLEARSPVRFAWLRSFRERARRRHERALWRLARSGRLGSALDLLL